MHINYAKIGKILMISNIFLILILPELNNIHYDPLPQFWTEILFAILCISLFIITALSNKKLYIPRISLALILFGVFIFLQQFIRPLDFVSVSYILIIELFIGLLLAISVNTIVKNYGLPTIFTYICVALLIGGILQSLIGFSQYTGLYAHFGDWVFYDELHPTTNIFGNIGQRNHYCHYLSWSFFALIYLRYNKRIPNYLFLISATWLSFSITLGASRSVFIYFALALIIGGIFLIKQRNKNSLRVFYLITASCILLFAIEYFYPLILHLIGDNASSGLSRIASDGGGAGRREVEWLKAWLTFKHHPFFGIGWAEYAKQSVILQNLFPNAPLNDGLFTNCHNLILQLLAETGIIGTLIVVIGVIYPLHYIIKNNLNTETILLLCMIATTIAHSMLEYPLWYMYFLGGFIMFLSVDKPLSSVATKKITLILAIPVIYIVYLIISNCIIVNKLADYDDAPENNLAQFAMQAKYLENIANQNGLLAYPALYTLDNYINIDDNQTNQIFTISQQLHYTNKLANFHPYADTLIKQAKLYWKIGNHKKAKQIAYEAIIAYPVYKAIFLDEFNNN